MANETEKIFEDKTLDELFCEAAEKFPEKEAVVSVQRRMTSGQPHICFNSDYERP